MLLKKPIWKWLFVHQTNNNKRQLNRSHQVQQQQQSPPTSQKPQSRSQQQPSSTLQQKLPKSQQQQQQPPKQSQQQSPPKSQQQPSPKSQQKPLLKSQQPALKSQQQTTPKSQLQISAPQQKPSSQQSKSTIQQSNNTSRTAVKSTLTAQIRKSQQQSTTKDVITQLNDENNILDYAPSKQYAKKGDKFIMRVNPGNPSTSTFTKMPREQSPAGSLFNRQQKTQKKMTNNTRTNINTSQGANIRKSGEVPNFGAISPIHSNNDTTQLFQVTNTLGHSTPAGREEINKLMETQYESFTTQVPDELNLQNFQRVNKKTTME